MLLRIAQQDLRPNCRIKRCAPMRPLGVFSTKRSWPNQCLSFFKSSLTASLKRPYPTTVRSTGGHFREYALAVNLHRPETLQAMNAGVRFRGVVGGVRFGAKGDGPG